MLDFLQEGKLGVFSFVGMEEDGQGDGCHCAEREINVKA